MSGDGRTAVRASYGLTYDFPNAEYQLINANSPPVRQPLHRRGSARGFDRPYAHLGGDPHPIPTNRDTQFLPFGAYGATDPNINSPRIQQWNVTVERQLGTVWQVAASYIGSHTDRLWEQVAINPGVFLGVGPCTLEGVFYPTCSNNANLNQRRVFSLSGENPAAARLLGNMDIHESVGTQDYKGPEAVVPASRGRGPEPQRQLHGVPLLRRSGAPDRRLPADCQRVYRPRRLHVRPRLVRSGPDAHRRLRRRRARRRRWRTARLRCRALRLADLGHPQRAVRAAAECHRRPGPRVQRHSESARRPGARQPVWRQEDAERLAQPGRVRAARAGHAGQLPRNSVRAPGYWSVDLALSRLISFGASGTLELRVETFNLFNTFNWGAPIAGPIQGGRITDTNFSSPAFGRVTTMAGTPRVMQFGVKYGF